MSGLSGGMEFIVASRAEIERGILVRGNYVVISIRDPDKRGVRVRKQPGLQAVLRLAFHDAEPVRSLRLPPHVRLMHPRHAGRIREFVREWAGRVSAIVVHCEQGASRSAAVAAALCKLHGGDPRRFFRDYQPNRYVFDLVCNENVKGDRDHEVRVD